jgi:hypothetical protein
MGEKREEPSGRGFRRDVMARTAVSLSEFKIMQWPTKSLLSKTIHS